MASRLRKFATDIMVEGTNHRPLVVLQFARGRDQRLEMVREPNNRHDEHAIAIVGHCRGWVFPKRLMIGYVPRQLAKEIAVLEVFDLLEITLWSTLLRRNGCYGVAFSLDVDIVAYRERYRATCEYPQDVADAAADRTIVMAGEKFDRWRPWK